jgi:hypothetical protein
MPIQTGDIQLVRLWQLILGALVIEALFIHLSGARVGVALSPLILVLCRM